MKKLSVLSIFIVLFSINGLFSLCGAGDETFFKQVDSELSLWRTKFQEVSATKLFCQTHEIQNPLFSLGYDKTQCDNAWNIVKDLDNINLAAKVKSLQSVLILNALHSCYWGMLQICAVMQETCIMKSFLDEAIGWAAILLYLDKTSTKVPVSPEYFNGYVVPQMSMPAVQMVQLGMEAELSKQETVEGSLFGGFANGARIYKDRAFAVKAVNVKDIRSIDSSLSETDYIIANEYKRRTIHTQCSVAAVLQATTFGSMSKIDRGVFDGLTRNACPILSGFTHLIPGVKKAHIMNEAERIMLSSGDSSRKPIKTSKTPAKFQIG